MKVRGFTLIELLIVVAIIAILAAIAVPNFLEAQTRAKVSRVKADIRSAATALEAYRIDWNAYPFDGYNYDGSGSHQYNYWFIPIDVSTPIAYMTSCSITDPFRQALLSMSSAYWHWQWREVRYINTDATWGTTYDAIESGSDIASIYHAAVMGEWGGWYLDSAGPDLSYGPTGWPGVTTYPASPIPYDATNGTVSRGDIIRSQAAPGGYKNAS